MIQRVMSRFSVEIFVSRYRKSLQGNPSRLQFEKFLIAKKFIDKKWGEYQDFPSKVFCLTMPKNFAGQPFRVSLTSGIEKIYAQGGYVTNFCRKFFESQYRNIS